MRDYSESLKVETSVKEMRFRRLPRSRGFKESYCEFRGSSDQCRMNDPSRRNRKDII